MNPSIPDAIRPPARPSTTSKRRQPPRRASPQKTKLPPPVGDDDPLLSLQEQEFDEQTLDLELRGRLPAGFNPVKLQASGYAGALHRSADLQLLPLLRSTKSNSSTQSRSTSPVKTMHDLAMAEPPITFSEANRRMVKPPEEVSCLYGQLLDASEGFGLLPGSLKDIIKTYASEFEFRKLHEVYFNKGFDKTALSAQSELDIWNEVKCIRENAIKCNEDGDSEAGWGEMVYSRIFDVALQYSAFKDKIGWKNITAARIEPKYLVPTHLSGKPFGSKMVDYAIFLEPDETMHREILQVLRHLPEDDQNINQTRSTPVKYRPITVNIEVKVPGEGKNDVLVQLSVWVAAQFKKLNMLAGKLVTIGIPVASIEGHDLRGYIAFQKENGEITVWGNDLFGDSSSILGIYRSIAVIQVLAHWSCTEYKSWFEKDVLGRAFSLSL